MGSLTDVESSILNPIGFAPNHSGRQTDQHSRERGDFLFWVLNLFIQQSSLSQHCLDGDVKSSLLLQRLMTAGGCSAASKGNGRGLAEEVGGAGNPTAREC